MASSDDIYSVKKETVDYIVFFASSLIPQPLIAYIVMKVLNEDWGVFWYTIVAINVFQLIMWTVNTLITALMFKIYFKNRLVENVYNELIEYNFPTSDFNPGKGNSDTYYFEIATDSDIPCNIRIKATTYYNEFNAIGVGILANRRIHNIHEEALAKYFKDYPNISVSSYFN